MAHRSKYQAKQGRGKNDKGVVTGRTRISRNSPFHPQHVTDYSHPQARIALRALARVIEDDQRNEGSFFNVSAS